MKSTTPDPTESRVDPITFVSQRRGKLASGDLVKELREWENPAKPDERLVISTMAANLYAMAEAFAQRAENRHGKRPSMDTVLSFCMCRGLQRFASLPGVETITRARASVLRYGSTDSLVWFETFPFEMPHGHSGRRTVWTRVCAADRTECAKLATALGLTGSKVAQLAICCVLVDVDLSAADHTILQSVLTDIGARLKARAKEAGQRAFDLDPPNASGPRLPRRSFAALKARLEAGE